MSQELTGPARLPPTDFHASRDRTLAGSLTLNPIPRKLASQFPKIRRDHYAVLKSEEVLLVDPQTRKVVAVIKDGPTRGLESRAAPRIAQEIGSWSSACG